MLKEKLIGLSLSFCVGDIIRGKVAIEQVQMIIASTKCATRAEWHSVLAKYSKSCWREYPKRACDIAWQFIDAGKVEQPRLHGDPYPHIAGGHWETLDGKRVRLH